MMILGSGVRSVRGDDDDGGGCIVVVVVVLIVMVMRSDPWFCFLKCWKWWRW